MAVIVLHDPAAVHSVGVVGPDPGRRRRPAIAAVGGGLEARVAQLEARVAELDAKLTQNSSNSSKPPSSDGPQVKPAPPKTPSGKRRGGQHGTLGILGDETGCDLDKRLHYNLGTLIMYVMNLKELKLVRDSAQGVS